MKPKEEKKEAQKTENQVKPLTLTPAQLNPYAGDYWSSELGVAYRLGIVDGSLKVVALLDGSGNLRTNNLPLKSFGATAIDEFVMEKTPIAIHFQRGSNQLVNGFTLDAGRTRGMIFSRHDSR